MISKFGRLLDLKPYKEFIMEDIKGNEIEINI